MSICRTNVCRNSTWNVVMGICWFTEKWRRNLSGYVGKQTSGCSGNITYKEMYTQCTLTFYMLWKNIHTLILTALVFLNLLKKRKRSHYILRKGTIVLQMLDTSHTIYIYNEIITFKYNKTSYLKVRGGRQWRQSFIACC